MLSVGKSIAAGKSFSDADSAAISDVEYALDDAGYLALAYDKHIAAEWWSLSRRARAELGVPVCIYRLAE